MLAMLGFTTSAVAAPTFHLAVEVIFSGSSSGVVTSTPPGINCPGDCDEDFSTGTEVELVASPDDGSILNFWSGDCSGQDACVLEMSADRSVTATFIQPVPQRLKIYIPGDDSQGSVAISSLSDPCDVHYCEFFVCCNKVVTLTPLPGSGWVFGEWSGDCSGSGICQLAMTEPRSVTAHMHPTLQVAVVGQGSVSSSPAGIDCPGQCANTFPQGVVTLTPHRDPGYAFTGWSGNGCAGTGVCNLYLLGVRSVTATFELAIFVDDFETGDTNLWSASSP